MGNIGICANKKSTTQAVPSNIVLVPSQNQQKTRENIATWHRDNIAVTDVYDIIETLGEGRMGGVYKVRRKVEDRGLHNEETKKVRNDGGNTNNNLDVSGGGASISSHSGRRSKSPGVRTNKRNRKKIEKYQEEILSKTNTMNSTTVSVSQQQQQDQSDNVSIATAGSNIKPKPILRKPSRGNLAAMANEGNNNNDTNTDNGEIGTEQGKSEDDTKALSDLFPCGDTKTDVVVDVEQESASTATSAAQSNSSKKNTTTTNTTTDNQEQENDDSIIASMFSKTNHQELGYDDMESDNEDDLTLSERSVNSIGTFNTAGNTSTSAMKKKRGRDARKPRLRFQRLYACKTIKADHIKNAELDELLNEIYIMRDLDHPYIIRLYEVYQVEKKLWLVMDMCTGGNLSSRRLGESQVPNVLKQILRGVAYLHKRGICHRDLKLENILYENSRSEATIRLIDFGLSKKFEETSAMKKKGAAYTMSPEIASETGKYTTKSDVWAIGVIVWVLLAGDYPFLKEDEDLKIKEKKDALIEANYRYGVTWRGRGISNQAKEFVANCLKKNPEDRWTVIEALDFVKEKWEPMLRSREESSLFATTPKAESLDIDLDEISRFCEFGMFKKIVLITMVNTMDRTEVGKLGEIFLAIDTNHSGTISLQELKTAFCLNNVDDKKLQMIFAGIDHDASGQIHYAEFLAALSESHGLITLDRISDAFDRIDANGKGYINHDDLRVILGQNYEKNVVDKMIEEADFKKNGIVDYEELLQLMYGKAESTADGAENIAKSLKSLDVGFMVNSDDS